MPQERNDRPLKSGELPGPSTSDFTPQKPPTKEVDDGLKSAAPKSR